ncbi:hypothetical protein J2W46_003113 [Paraburkholderia strydomiana]|nr:hypothetical protein [Paraburkholderia strydomiana]
MRSASSREGSYGRIVEAAVPFNACHGAGVTCKLVVSAGDGRSNGRTEAAVYDDTLGVERAGILFSSDDINA